MDLAWQNPFFFTHHRERGPQGPHKPSEILHWGTINIINLITMPCCLVVNSGYMMVNDG